MTDTLPALTERREQIQALMDDLNIKIQQARANAVSFDELKKLIEQGRELDKQLDDVDNEIKTVEKAQRA